jgi:hypothetical protein
MPDYLWLASLLSAKIVSCSNINEYVRNYQDCLTLYTIQYTTKSDQSIVSSLASLQPIIYIIIYIIIWLSLYVLSVQSLSPPKPVGLDPPIFCRHTPNWLRNTDSQKKFEKKFPGKFVLGEKKFGDFFTKIFHENVERSVAFGECI